MLFIFFWALLGIAGASLASRKNRSSFMWFLICIISGVFGLLVLACSRPLSYDEELDQIEEVDVLGICMLILCTVAQIFSFQYIYKF